MNEKRMTGMAWLLALWLILAMIFLAMCSCGSKKVIMETIYEHDTVTVHHSDTVRLVELKIDSIVDIQTVYVGDTVYRDREHVITLNQNGDTIKEHLHEKQVEKHNEATNTLHNKTSTDSVSYFKAKCDSLQKVINKQHDKQEKVTKTKRPWTDYLIVAAVLAFALFLIRKIP